MSARGKEEFCEAQSEPIWRKITKKGQTCELGEILRKLVRYLLLSKRNTYTFPWTLAGAASAAV